MKYHINYKFIDLVCCAAALRPPTEPDDADRKKKTSKSKAKGSMPKPGTDSKPNISYPTVSVVIQWFFVCVTKERNTHINKWTNPNKVHSELTSSHTHNLTFWFTRFFILFFVSFFNGQNFEHTVHVGFDAITGEFTVSLHLFRFRCEPFFSFCLFNSIQLVSFHVCQNRWNKTNDHLLNAAFVLILVLRVCSSC